MELATLVNDPSALSTHLSHLPTSRQITLIAHFLQDFEATLSRCDDYIALTDHILAFATEKNLLDGVKARVPDSYLWQAVHQAIAHWKERMRKEESARKTARYWAAIHKQPTWKEFPDCLPRYLRETRTSGKVTFGNTLLIHWGALAKTATLADALAYLARYAGHQRVKLELLKQATDHFRSIDRLQEQTPEPEQSPLPLAEDVDATAMNSSASSPVSPSSSPPTLGAGDSSRLSPSKQLLKDTQHVAIHVELRDYHPRDNSRSMIRDCATPPGEATADTPSPTVEYGRSQQVGDGNPFRLTDISDGVQRHDSSFSSSPSHSFTTHEPAVFDLSQALWLPSCGEPMETSTICRLSRSVQETLPEASMMSFAELVAEMRAIVSWKQRVLHDGKASLEAMQIDSDARLATIASYEEVLVQSRAEVKQALIDQHALSEASISRSLQLLSKHIERHVLLVTKALTNARNREASCVTKLTELRNEQNDVASRMQTIRDELEDIESTFSRDDICASLETLALETGTLAHQAKACRARRSRLGCDGSSERLYLH